MIRVVLDTNVLVSALLSPFGNEAQALDSVQRGRILPCLSSSIVQEYKEVLARPKFQFDQSAIDGLTELKLSRGQFDEPSAVPRASPDPRDDHIIACAVAAGAAFIVTGNKRHFLQESYGEAIVVSARELIEFLNTRQSR